MDDGYAPASNFLVWVLNDEAPLSGSEQAEHNLRKVIALTLDADTSNRDWAVFILGNSEVGGPEVVAALKSRAEDVDERVRAEAIWGLARKAPKEALPFVQKALQAPFVTVPIFEAAALLADKTLVNRLRHFAENMAGNWTDDLVKTAIRACEAGIPNDC